jgi:hypothetical protein
MSEFSNFNSTAISGTLQMLDIRLNEKTIDKKFTRNKNSDI